MSTTEHPAPDLSAKAMWNSCTGFDEIAISKAFGESPYDLRDNPTMWMRALAFVHFRRCGDKDAPAYGAAMGITLGALEDYFPDEPDDLDDEDPAGKEQPPSS